NVVPLRVTGMQVTPPPPPNSSPSPQHTCAVAGVTIAVPGLHLSHSNSYPTLLLHAGAYLPNRSHSIPLWVSKEHEVRARVLRRGRPRRCYPTNFGPIASIPLTS
ncbi:hypothetical protein IRJ41_015180, partial [Triplophysa rosa]